MEDSRIVELYWQKNADAIKETNSKYTWLVPIDLDELVAVRIGGVILSVE